MSRPSGGAEPAEIVRSYLDAFSSGDAKAIASYVSDGFINEHTSALGSGCVGKQAYLDRLPAFLDDMTGLEYRLESLIADHGTVVAFYTMTARWQGTTPVSIRGVQRLTVQDGHIIQRVDYWDSASFLMQVDPKAKEVLKSFGC